MEIELKLLLNARDATALRQHPLLEQLASAPPREQSMQDLYFDTPDLLLRQCGAGLRVRRVGDAWIQTLKAGGSVAAGLHSRNEWESPVAGPLPELALLRKLVGRKGGARNHWARLLRSPGLGDDLIPIFSTQILRTIWDLQLADGDLVECVLDQGHLEREGQRVEVSEIELELKSGQAHHLFDVALALQQDITLRIGNLSKADRGYALYAPLPVAAVQAGALALTKQMTLAEAFRCIAGNCLAQVQGNEAGVVHRLDAESLHQMRVGLRRLDCALTLFEGVRLLPPNLQKELAWLMARLGAARDWDVLAGTTLPAVAAAAPGEKHLGALRLAVLVQSREKHAEAAAAVGSPRTTRLMLELARWLLEEAVAPPPTLRLLKFSGRLLARQQRQLHRRGKQLQDGSAQARHRLRIAVKKMRYAIEFFSALYPSRKMQRCAKALAAVQDQLGVSNDAVVADRLLRQFEGGQRDVVASAGFMRGFLRAGTGRDDKALRRRCERFVRMRLPD